MSPHPPHDFEFLLFDGFSNMVLANAMEPLRDVKLRGISGSVDWRVSTMDGRAVRSSSGLQISPDGVFDPDRPGRRLFLVAGYHVRSLATPALITALRRAARGAQQIIAVDTAAWLLAAAGLLDGQSATIHWQELDDFEETFSRVDVSISRYVRAGSFITCGGASTTLDLMLDLIKELFGAAVAFEASTMFLYDAERQASLRRGASRLEGNAPRALLAALDVMSANIESPLSTGEIASRSLISERTLHRVFQQELMMSPGKYYQMLRLQRARHLALETRLPLEQIALRCGFSSAPSLSRAIRKEFGVPIRHLSSRKA
ncbi:GlxA family transcriptional regulator [Paracoccus seriniphilus]|uniref:Transcriptional regulator GlxA family, contains an amidase domain and an AraC-type DNA-binding HTH domain n=1 Tax=Paracoccus seriniphilus TaxID=184748 RepID=A0A239PU74_9RHOB|nr:helix-turn-helix domain-containing protein [Paracoccus seriniphilus]WCR15365.1 helix-turn-helix domain-containing protein [Paracoccus seriniphilus]SNT73844.1 Transcriptional regulator GlxA family, contains an amidase domain and an AraC-type DNA-binding HTH domain [Paracoccus seriniphilus]